MQVLIVEDDPLVGQALVQGFSEAGHVCNLAVDGEQGSHRANAMKYDAIILDMMLPKKSGMEVLRELRQKGAMVPVIMLTALGSVDNRVEGLAAGADDYLVKPFEFRELLARVDAVCRRSTNTPTPVLSTGELTVDLSKRVAIYRGQSIELTPIELSILELLTRHAGQVVTRNMICEHIWGYGWSGTTNVIEVHINRLRGKLAGSGADSLVQTVRGRGYVIRAS